MTQLHLLRTFLKTKTMSNQLTFQDPYNLTDAEIDNLMIYSGTYNSDTSKEIKTQWKEAYRKAEADTNEQILKAGGVKQWYESGEGRLL